MGMLLLKSFPSLGNREGAINVPLRELGQALGQLPTDKRLVLVCGSGHRPTVGMAALQVVGFCDVKSMAGGVMAWNAAELPVVTE